ncbi:hypothetical protein TNCV_1213701 [Trichonephila clavipes]|nr:hypothetical protein TNCV_1213701 [Trichonephila clavipes]
MGKREFFQDIVNKYPGVKDTMQRKLSLTVKVYNRFISECIFPDGSAPCHAAKACNVHLEITTEKKQKLTRAFYDSIINFRKEFVCVKRNAAAGQAYRKKQWKGRIRVLFHVHRCLWDEVHE